ncbi:lipase family protein [Nocardia sp. CDC159]|uniref:Lipase family protein n=1 Tax=Nocardia pulmonis TaxID=2951408 RepID=A0A9X2J3B7_9NOCA|nr:MULTISPECIES: lipase family protein [Nocardia]MCM6778931.1 lipase family protein [Nocardia pulmonis]MCM6791816.1 lipase family protein [Nocardia sp. CDC159]
MLTLARFDGLSRKIAVGSVAALVALTGVGVSTANAAPMRPQEDPFYQPPPGFETSAPGTVLASRPVALNFPVPAQAWQLLYRTTDLNSQPDATVTTVILPDSPTPDRPLLSVQMYHDAAGVDCSPSYQYQAAAIPDPSAMSQIPQMINALARGWAVSVPDFQGRFGHFAAATEPGYMILDGVRAAEQFAPLGLSAQTRVGMYGYSGGGLVTGWAAQVQPAYAPELAIAGATYAAPATDAYSVLQANNAGPLSGIPGNAIASLYGTYPEFADLLRPYLKPGAEAVLAHNRTHCLTESLVENSHRDWSEYLTQPIDQVMTTPQIAAFLSSVSLRESALTIPMFIYQADGDAAVPPAVTDAYVQKLCAAGTSISYRKQRGGDHVSTGLLAVGPAYDWLQQRFPADAPTPTGCDTQSIDAPLPR